jgi:hypothetical protein
MARQNAWITLWVLVTVVVSFWVGVLFASIFPRFDVEPIKLLIDTAVAIGTVGAVVVALRQGMKRVASLDRSLIEALPLSIWKLPSTTFCRLRWSKIVR